MLNEWYIKRSVWESILILNDNFFTHWKWHLPLIEGKETYKKEKRKKEKSGGTSVTMQVKL